MTSDTKSGERGFIDAQLLTTVIFSRNAVVAPRVVSSPTLLKELEDVPLAVEFRGGGPGVTATPRTLGVLGFLVCCWSSVPCVS